jgi:acyl-CoA synthetase (NDP forming)
MAPNKNWEALFKPQSLAIIGASSNLAKWGFNFTLHLIHGGYQGKIYPINPAGGEILGLKVYPSILDVPDPIDLAFILVPPEAAIAAVRQCDEKGVPACVVVTAGFGELGEEGQRLQKKLAEIAGRAGMALVGPNCAGITSPDPMRLYCTMQPSFPRPGHIAIFSQSGNIGGSIERICEKHDIGISRLVSTGNESVLTSADYLEYFAGDEATKVVVGYIEGVSHGKRFFENAKRLTRKKPLILMKAGRTTVGAKAAKSHTGALSGSDAVFEGLCRQCGILRVSSIEEMFDLATSLVAQPLPRGNRVGIAANGGGWGVITADACVELGLEVSPLPEETLQALDKRLPPWWNRQNPVDLVAGMSRGAFFKAIEALAKSPALDGIIALGFGYGGGMASLFRSTTYLGETGKAAADSMVHSDLRGLNFILDIITSHSKPVILASDRAVGADRDQNEAILAFRKKGIIVYPSPSRAAQVLAKMHEYSRYLNSEKINPRGEDHRSHD